MESQLGVLLGKDKRLIRAHHSLTADTSNIVLVASLVQLESLDTGASLHGWARVIATCVAADELEVLQVVCPQRETAITGRATDKVVASVLDDESQVQVPGQIDGELYLCNRADVDHVLGSKPLATITFKAPGFGWFSPLGIRLACKLCHRRTPQGEGRLSSGIIRHSLSLDHPYYYLC